MDENTLEVLVYIFENYNELEFFANQKAKKITDELQNVGFERDQIDQACMWLEGFGETLRRALDIIEQNHSGIPSPTNTRVFSHEETARFSTRSLGLLVMLEHCGILNPQTRELVIEHALALDKQEIEPTQLRWIIMIVLMDHINGQSLLEWTRELRGAIGAKSDDRLLH